jgi:hypothetical protein
MKWINSNGYVTDTQTGELIALMSKNPDQLRDKVVEIAPEMFTAIISFVEQIEAGKFTGRSTYKQLKQILERVPKSVIEDAKLQIQ